MNFFDNLFGVIAGPSVLAKVEPKIGFIPIDGQGGTIDIKGDATWLGLKNKHTQKKAYESCYALASVVDKLAEADITGTVEILRAGGKGKDDYSKTPWSTRMNTLLMNPNPLQSWEQFRGQQVVYKKIFGFCPVLPILPVGFSDPSYCISMINLPPWLFTATSTKRLINQYKLEEIVKEYSVTMCGETSTFTPDQIFILEDSFFQDEESDFLLPQSKLVGLDMAVSNLCAAMEADNVLLKKKGPLGFISHDAGAVKDSVAGYLPMTNIEKKEVQDALQQYGVSWNQYMYAVTRQAVKYNSTGFNVSELGTKDTVEASEKAICHRYGYAYVLYEASSSTFANLGVAAKDLYQSNVIPNNQKDFRKYNNFFKAKENNAIITCYYGDIPVLQEDKAQQASARLTLDNALEKEYVNDVITKNQWLTAQGLDTIPDGDKYYSETKKQPVLNIDPNAPENTGVAATGDAGDVVS